MVFEVALAIVFWQAAVRAKPGKAWRTRVVGYERDEAGRRLRQVEIAAVAVVRQRGVIGRAQRNTGIIRRYTGSSRPRESGSGQRV